MPKHGWSPVGEFDDADVVCAVHIIPVVEVDGFATEQEAVDFLAKMEELDLPCLTDEDGTIIATHVGHVASKNCVCGPTLRGDGLLPMFMHRMVN